MDNALKCRWQPPFRAADARITFGPDVFIYYITLHYITLHYITLHYITLHYITLHYITLHYITLHYITLHYTQEPQLEVQSLAAVFLLYHTSGCCFLDLLTECRSTHSRVPRACAAYAYVSCNRAGLLLHIARGLPLTLLQNLTSIAYALGQDRAHDIFMMRSELTETFSIQSGHGW